MDIKDIRKLLDAVAATEVRELTLETGDYKLTVRRGGEQVETVRPAAPQPSPEPAPLPAAVPAPQASPEPAAAGEPANDNFVEVVAPIVGTFYSAPSPDAPDFVRVGDRVEAGSVLCIIEAMKLMNEIEAEVSGTVAEILVYNEEPVEYGQALFRIEPS